MEEMNRGLGSSLWDRVKRLRARRWHAKEIAGWQRQGCPVPPPHSFKQALIREYARRYSLSIFVETGTYLGDMVEAMRDTFREIYSIELSADLHSRAARRFAGVENVHLVQGDSGTRLGEIIPQLSEASLFWLDGHYSAGMTARGDKDTPILDELDLVLRRPRLGHVILIDDARLFGSDPAYPTTASIEQITKSQLPNAAVSVDDDVIRIVLRP